MTPNEFFAQLRNLYERGDYEKLLRLADAVDELSPFTTMAKAWQLIVAARTNDKSRVLKLADYNNLILIFSISSGPFSSIEARVRSEFATIAASRSVPITSFMPYVKGKKTGDLFEEHDLPATYELFSLCYSAFLVHNAATEELRRVSGIAYLSAWLNTIEPTGSIGAHFHPDAWLSAVYYPFPDTNPASSGVTNSSIVFGRYPPEMGGGARVPACNVRPQFGQLIVFPSYLGHQVVTQRGSCQRVSLASDLVIPFEGTQ